MLIPLLSHCLGLQIRTLLCSPEHARGGVIMFSIAFCHFPFHSWLLSVKNICLLCGLHALLPGPFSLVHMAALGRYLGFRGGLSLSCFVLWRWKAAWEMSSVAWEEKSTSVLSSLHVFSGSPGKSSPSWLSDERVDVKTDILSGKERIDKILTAISRLPHKSLSKESW